MKRVIVTGGAGFIGSAIVQHLLSSGYEVYVIDNLSFGNRRNIPAIGDDRFFNTDILDSDGLKTVFLRVRPASVIHLAAIHFIPYCNSHPFLSANINIQGSINIADACIACGSVEKVFFASTAAVYPVMEGPIPETTPASSSDIYGLSKIAGERIFHNFFLRSNIPTVICRFFNAFGPNETNPHLIPAIQEQVLNGKRTLNLGNLDPRRDYIYTSDMAEAVVLLLEKYHEGFDIFNLGSGKEYSVKEVVKAFEQALDEKLIINQDASLIRKIDRMHLLADTSKLCNYLNWSPGVSFNEGIRALLLTNLKVT